jgi:hypothetical protein
MVATTLARLDTMQDVIAMACSGAWNQTSRIDAPTVLRSRAACAVLVKAELGLSMDARMRRLALQEAKPSA